MSAREGRENNERSTRFLLGVLRTAYGCARAICVAALERRHLGLDVVLPRVGRLTWITAAMSLMNTVGDISEEKLKELEWYIVDCVEVFVLGIDASSD